MEIVPMIDQTSKKLISIVIPVWNEEGNIFPCHTELLKFINPLSNRYQFEILFCDNHSTDNTFEEIRQLNAKDPRVRGVRWSKNFGYHRSIYGGYLNCNGAAAIQLDVDLQDPPELIPVFLEHWEQGFKFVYGQRRTRQEAWLDQKIRAIFYRFLNLLSDEPLPNDVAEFRLIDRCIIDELEKNQDHQPYLRGLIAKLGFKRKAVLYDRSVRTLGETKFNFKSLFKMAMDGILNHSVVPLRIATLSGLVISAGSFLGMVFIFITKLIVGDRWPAGFATISMLLTMLMGVNFLFLGIIGEYLGRVYRQLKKESVTIVEDFIATSTDESRAEIRREKSGSLVKSQQDSFI